MFHALLCSCSSWILLYAQPGSWSAEWVRNWSFFHSGTIWKSFSEGWKISSRPLFFMWKFLHPLIFAEYFSANVENPWLWCVCSPHKSGGGNTFLGKIFIDILRILDSSSNPLRLKRIFTREFAKERERVENRKSYRKKIKQHQIDLQVDGYKKWMEKGGEKLSRFNLFFSRSRNFIPENFWVHSRNVDWKRRKTAKTRVKIKTFSKNSPGSRKFMAPKFNSW